MLPPKLPVLFKGSEIMMVGRYKEGGKHTFTISGSLSGKPAQYTCAVDLPRGAGDAANEFLAPLWAARQIGYLLQEIRLHGANKELIEEVVRLSKQYGIVTEYTDFIAMAGPMRREARPCSTPGCEERIATARGEQAGQWAVNQAANDKALQQRAVAAPAANFYRDRRGNVTTVRTVTQVGRRAFYLQDGQWVDAEEAGTRKTRVVKLLSPEYFELLTHRRDVRPGTAARLGAVDQHRRGAHRHREGRQAAGREPQGQAAAGRDRAGTEPADSGQEPGPPRPESADSVAEQARTESAAGKVTARWRRAELRSSRVAANRHVPGPLRGSARRSLNAIHITETSP